MNSIGRRKASTIWWDYSISGFLLLQTLGAFGILSRLYYGEWQGGFSTTTLLATVLNLLFVLASVTLFVNGLAKRGNLKTGEILALVLLLLYLVSALWSVDPASTFRRGGLFAFFLLGTMGISAHLNSRQFMALVEASCFLSAVASILLLLFSSNSAYGLPESSEAPSEVMYALRGIFSQKNALGQVMAAGVLASMHSLREAASRKAVFWSVARSAVFLGVALASKSSTSVFVIVFLVLTNLFVWLHRKGGGARKIGGLLTTLSLVAALFVALFPDSVLELAGKDPTLTGRTELWDLVIDKIDERPLLGWGYSSFWEMANPLAVEISAKVRWLVPHAHNGLLEMLLEVGIVGTLLIITIFLRSVWLGWRCLRTSNRELGLSLLLCCGAILITGTTESVLVDFSGGWAIIFFVLSFMSERSIGALSSNRVFRRDLPTRSTVYKEHGSSAAKERKGLLAWSAQRNI